MGTYISVRKNKLIAKCEDGKGITICVASREFSRAHYKKGRRPQNLTN